MRLTGFTIIFMLLISATVYGECWDSKELRQIRMNELEGELILSFKDAVECSPVEGADVTFINKEKGRYSLTTDSKGYARFPLALIENIDDGILYCIVKKKGYIPIKLKLPILSGTIWQQRFLMSKELPLDKVRFVLQWGESPKDLDLHLVKKEGFHISYRDKKNIPNLAKLDRDDIDGFGPETITLDRIDAQAEYRLFVQNYSNETPFPGKNNSNEVKIFVYANNKLEKYIVLPESKNRNYDVLKIINKKLIYLP